MKLCLCFPPYIMAGRDYTSLGCKSYLAVEQNSFETQFLVSVYVLRCTDPVTPRHLSCSCFPHNTLFPSPSITTSPPSVSMPTPSSVTSEQRLLGEAAWKGAGFTQQSGPDLSLPEKTGWGSIRDGRGRFSILEKKKSS